MKAVVRSAGVALLLASAGMARAESTQDQSYRDEVLGVSLSHPSEVRVVTDEYLLDEEHGFTLVPPEHGSRDAESADAMVLRVVWLHQESPETLEAAARRFMDAFPGEDIQRREAKVAGRPALVLENAPGLVPTTYIYVAAEGKLFQVIYPRPTLDERARSLLHTLSFEPARQSLQSRNLTRARDALFGPAPKVEGAGSFLRSMGALNAGRAEKPADMTASAVAGCVDYSTGKYLQTPFTSAANGNGYSQAGPSYYGQGLHTGCNNGGSQNDYYALDMPMRTGDAVLNPTNGGTVVWAGWASGGWASLGRTVIIDQGGGYKSLAAHLNSINVSSGQYVNADSVIGGVGGSGYGSNTYWGPHLHQGLYLNAAVSGGGTYGGQSAQPTNVHYCRNGCANYYSFIGNQQTLSY
ncbi:M23 family metallopeptidase [Archangium sp.]|uniref:M23 family metallopeptidase n=1 Tax=Archangium sp. TaxID=1872627 RepID=UPI002D40E9B7|nr:M23 family metallopeptidase [Archangium sp.]HYO54928.1 M23 family metallopeptidase [Archangium sp.]